MLPICLAVPWNDCCETGTTQLHSAWDGKPWLRQKKSAMLRAWLSTSTRPSTAVDRRGWRYEGATLQQVAKSTITALLGSGGRFTCHYRAVQRTENFFRMSSGS